MYQVCDHQLLDIENVSSQIEICNHRLILQNKNEVALLTIIEPRIIIIKTVDKIKADVHNLIFHF
jgi:hypothetical protein